MTVSKIFKSQSGVIFLFQCIFRPCPVPSGGFLRKFPCKFGILLNRVLCQIVWSWSSIFSFIVFLIRNYENRLTNFVGIVCEWIGWACVRTIFIINVNHGVFFCTRWADVQTQKCEPCKNHYMKDKWKRRPKNRSTISSDSFST